LKGKKGFKNGDPKEEERREGKERKESKRR